MYACCIVCEYPIQLKRRETRRRDDLKPGNRKQPEGHLRH